MSKSSYDFMYNILKERPLEFWNWWDAIIDKIYKVELDETYEEIHDRVKDKIIASQEVIRLLLLNDSQSTDSDQSPSQQQW